MKVFTNYTSWNKARKEAFKLTSHIDHAGDVTYIHGVSSSTEVARWNDAIGGTVDGMLVDGVEVTS